MPQQLANLLLPTIQPNTRETTKVASSSGDRSNSFARTLDRQLDRQQPANESNQARSNEKSSTTAQARPAKNDVNTDENINTQGTESAPTSASEEASNEDTTPSEGFAVNLNPVNTPAAARAEVTNFVPLANKQPELAGAPGNLPGDKTLPETALKATATGKVDGQKPLVLPQSSDLFTKELASINSELGAKPAFDEAKPQSGETKGNKNANGLLQKALSELSGFQNTAQTGSGNATPNANAYAHANANASFLNTADSSMATAEISQSVEELSITPQNAHTVSTKFGSAIQSNQSAQTAINSLAVQIAKHVDQGINRFQIRMDPPELGRIDVKLEFGQDGRMTANLTVERPETLDMLLRDAKALERALAGSGLNTDKDSLNFSLKDQSANEYADFQRDAESGSDKSQNSDEEGDVNSPMENTIAAYKSLISSTAVDIRI